MKTTFTMQEYQRIIVRASKDIQNAYRAHLRAKAKLRAAMAKKYTLEEIQKLLQKP